MREKWNWLSITKTDSSWPSQNNRLIRFYRLCSLTFIYKRRAKILNVKIAEFEHRFSHNKLSSSWSQKLRTGWICIRPHKFNLIVCSGMYHSSFLRFKFQMILWNRTWSLHRHLNWFIDVTKKHIFKSSNEKLTNLRAFGCCVEYIGVFFLNYRENVTVQMQIHCKMSLAQSKMVSYVCI